MDECIAQCLQLVFCRSGFVRRREPEDRFRFSRDGVALGAAGEGDETGVCVFENSEDRAGDELVRVRAAEVDVRAGVAAEEAFDVDGDGLTGEGLPGERTGHGVVHAAGTADGGDALVFGVEVQHEAAVELRIVEHVGAEQADFLIGREDTFEGRVGQRVVVEQRHHGGVGDSVVAAEGGAVRGEPAVFGDIHVDAFVLKVVVTAVDFLADHVHVSLQDDGRFSFAAVLAGLLDDDVQRLILVHFQTAVLRELHEEVADLLVVERAAGDCTEVFEVPEQRCRFVTGDLVFHKNSPD